jgi:multiple antibiotic resistance protein
MRRPRSFTRWRAASPSTTSSSSAVFEVLGATILKFFGISLPIVQLSGGMVVAAMGWGVLNERSAGADFRNKEEETGQSGEPDTRHLEEGVFYPYTFPITSGPGTLVGLLTVTAHISDKESQPQHSGAP